MATDTLALKNDATSTVATLLVDVVGGNTIPTSKISLGGEETNDGFVSSANPMPVTHAALTELAAAIDTEVQVDIVSSALPAGAATAAKQDTGNTTLATLALESGGNLAGAATSLAVIDDWDESDRAKVNVIAGQAGIAGGTGVDGATVPRVTLATNVPLPAGDNNIGNVDIVTMPNVTLAAGTNTNEVVGDAAHGAGVAGNPLLAGLEGRSTAPTAVDDGDVVRALATLLGKQVIYPFALPANSWSYASPAAVTDTNDDEAKAAVASTRHYITGLQVMNSDATVGTAVVIKDGSTVLWQGYAAALGGGCSATFNPPLRGTANTAVNVANITTSAETYFNLQGFSATE